MADDYAPAISADDEEEQKKQWQGVPYAYPPAAPSASLATPSPDAPPAKYESVPQPAPDLPLEQAPGPQRPSWSQYAPAEKHGWAKVGSVLAGLTGPTDEIVNRRPMENAQRNYQAATSEFDRGQGEKLATEKQASETGLQGAQADEAKARADALRNPAPKPKEEEWSIDPNRSGPHGEPVELEKNSGQTRLAQGLPSGVTLNKQAKPDTPEQQFIDAEAAKGIPLTKAIHDYAMASQRPPQQEAGSYMPLVDSRTGQITGAWDPKTNHHIAAPDMSGTTSSGAGIANRNAEAAKKEAQPLQDVVDEIAESREYAASPSATNDYGLLMNFIGVTKPASLAKLRLNQNEVHLATGTRGTLGDIDALVQKVEDGQMLTPDQRKSMLSTMDIVEKFTNRRMQQLGGGHGGQQGGGEAQSVYAKNPKTGERVMSSDGGKTWRPAPAQ